MVAHIDHAHFCFDVLHSRLHSTTPHLPRFENHQYPLFVTYSSGPEKELRGCIGNFEPLFLHEGLKEYALVAALRDRRFQPVRVEELGGLSCGVSLLVEFERNLKYLDWTVSGLDCYLR